MYLPKTTDYLSTITLENYDKFNLHMVNRGRVLISVASEVIDMLEWEQIMTEPLMQFSFETLIGDTEEQFYLSNGGFSEDENSSNLDLSEHYDIPQKYEIELFDIFVRELLEKNTRRCPIYVLEKLPSKFLDIIFAEKYIDRNYSIIELAKLYESTKNELFLPKEARDIFIF